MIIGCAAASHRSRTAPPTDRASTVSAGAGRRGRRRHPAGGHLAARRAEPQGRQAAGRGGVERHGEGEVPAPAPVIRHLRGIERQVEHAGAVGRVSLDVVRPGGPGAGTGG